MTGESCVQRTRRWRRVASGIVLLAIIAHVVVAWLGRPPGFLTGQDDAEYVILSRSLKAGGYHELHRVDRPAHAQYPPGYPALIAVWSVIAGDGFDAIVLLNIALSAAMLLLVRRALARRGFGEVEATATVAVLAVNPFVVAYAGSGMSETSYTLLAIASAFLLAEERPGARRLAAGGALAILAALTRSIGITLLAAVAAHWIVQRRWKAVAIFGFACAVTVGAWLLWTALAPEQYVGASYVADIRATGGGAPEDAADETGPGVVLRRVPGHAAWYMRIALPWALGVPTVPATIIDNIVVVVLTIVFGALGLVVFARRWRIALLYLSFYGALLAVWIWRTERFLVPLLPLVVPVLLVGATAVGTQLRLRRPWLVTVVVALVLVASGGVRTAGRVREAIQCGRQGDLPPPACLTPDQASFFEAVRWTTDHTPADAVFLAAKGAPFALYTGRKVIGYGAAVNADTTTFLPFLREQGTDFILLGVLEHKEVEQLAPLLLDACGELQLEARFPPNTYLFSITQTPNRERSEAACAALESYVAATAGRVF